MLAATVLTRFAASLITGSKSLSRQRPAALTGIVVRAGLSSTGISSRARLLARLRVRVEVLASLLLLLLLLLLTFSLVLLLELAKMLLPLAGSGGR